MKRLFTLATLGAALAVTGCSQVPTRTALPVIEAKANHEAVSPELQMCEVTEAAIRRRLGILPF